MAGYRRARAAAVAAGVSAGHALPREVRQRILAEVRAAGVDLDAAPKRAQARPERKRATFTTRIGAAKTPAQKVSAAADFVGSALAEVSAIRADQVATAVVEQLRNLAEQLLEEGIQSR
jgi:hypothetical protein